MYGWGAPGFTGQALLARLADVARHMLGCRPCSPPTPGRRSWTCWAAPSPRSPAGCAPSCASACRPVARSPSRCRSRGWPADPHRRTGAADRPGRAADPARHMGGHRRRDHRRTARPARLDHGPPGPTAGRPRRGRRHPARDRRDHRARHGPAGRGGRGQQRQTGRRAGPGRRPVRARPRQDRRAAGRAAAGRRAARRPGPGDRDRRRTGVPARRRGTAGHVPGAGVPRSGRAGRGGARADPERRRRRPPGRAVRQPDDAARPAHRRHRTARAARPVRVPAGGGNLGPLDVSFAPKLPTGIGVALRAGPVQGGGYLAVDPDGRRFAGALAFRLGFIAITAFGSYSTTADGDPSFVAVLGIRFRAGIQLGFGFELTGVGGLVGYHRRADPDAAARPARLSAPRATCSSATTPWPTPRPCSATWTRCSRWPPGRSWSGRRSRSAGCPRSCGWTWPC